MLLGLVGVVSAVWVLGVVGVRVGVVSRPTPWVHLLVADMSAVWLIQ